MRFSCQLTFGKFKNEQKFKLLIFLRIQLHVNSSPQHFSIGCQTWYENLENFLTVFDSTGRGSCENCLWFGTILFIAIEFSTSTSTLVFCCICPCESSRLDNSSNHIFYNFTGSSDFNQHFHHLHRHRSFSFDSTNTWHTQTIASSSGPPIKFE